jgi:transcriptional regulator GlxA family with amidase domain
VRREGSSIPPVDVVLQSPRCRSSPGAAFSYWAMPVEELGMTKSSSKLTSHIGGPSAEVGILLYPGAQLASILGLTDMFLVANRFSLEHGGTEARQLAVSHWEDNGFGGSSIIRTFSSHAPGRQLLDWVIFPPTLETQPGGGTLARCLDWARAQHARGSVLCSVCGGAFLLAATGLLDGKSATTHWSYSQKIGEEYPRIDFDTAKLIIDHGDVVTAGGLMAWVDVALKLIDRFLSPTVMLATAKYFLVDPAGREQRFYASFTPAMNHGDEAVLKVQRMFHGGGSRGKTVSELAAMVSLGQRTFLRRFERATGLTPTEYVQTLKIGKARELLEFTKLTIQEIAFKLGYEEVSSFGRVFRRIVGLAPRDYRNRFGVGRSSPEPSRPKPDDGQRRFG